MTNTMRSRTLLLVVSLLVAYAAAASQTGTKASTAESWSLDELDEQLQVWKLPLLLCHPGQPAYETRESTG